MRIMEALSPEQVLETIGRSNFMWLAGTFNEGTCLKDVPAEILDRVGAVDITLRDYQRDRSGMTCIALITFAYRMAGRSQDPKHGPKDILLLKVLAKNESSKRKGEELSKNPLWEAPLYELITGEVGEKIRNMKIISDPG